MPCGIIANLCQVNEVGVFFSWEAKKQAEKYVFIASNTSLNYANFFMGTNINVVMLESKTRAKVLFKF